MSIHHAFLLIALQWPMGAVPIVVTDINVLIEKSLNGEVLSKLVESEVMTA
jgi:hypothetical protein